MIPKVSIIIPTYNGEKFLEKTIKSVLNQTYENFEIIVINDGSQDNTEKIIEKFQSNKKIKYIKHHNNTGIIKTVNEGYKIAEGEYVMALGHDDLLKENHLEVMLKEFNENTSVVFCNSELINEKDEIIRIMFDDDIKHKQLKNILFELSKENCINSCGAIVNKQKAYQVNLYEEFTEFPHYGEWYFWIKLATVGDIKFCKNVRSQYRRHDTNITNTFKEKDNIKKLIRFYNKCRKFAYKSGNFSFLEKQLFRIHYLYANLKSYIKYILAR